MEDVKQVGDAVNISAIWAWLLGVLPSLPDVAAVVSIIYTCLRIWDWYKEKK